ncbi:transcription factor FER-LIKE IRON DEFICIENCY-INDUCED TRANSCRIPTION FACTOR-like [Salvia miltiorrhiza]|uniref:Basic helix-loop-helix transcription factor n=1 Tax=Salvia miltiorrhiza TaxID=226208 RepID=A0A0H3YB44_SALMI|nr:transcription factor FER-LIKE IRON DEFICIENCY-INDUCED TRANSCRIPTION FACTOR-like [Salvia miltiorrhiza]AKN09604.1 basic helix-loop-helix transcription factor [Salvia miltiorrhiza]
MDRFDDENGGIPFPQYYASEFGLIDFMDEANVDQFIDLIRGENIQNDQPIFNLFDQDYQYCRGDESIHVAAAVEDCHFLPPPPPQAELFDFDAGHEFGLLNACEITQAEEEELLMDEDDQSSGSGTTTTATGSRSASGKADRSKTLVSERRRRGRMKEKLYALRSLVPNITKMDKASIVGDAVLYVQDLQIQARKIRAEIAGFEEKTQHKKTTQNGSKSNSTTCFYPTTKKIFKMEVSQVEDRGFYVRIVANGGHGVAALLYRALESLTTFDVRSSSLAASSDQNYVFTFTLHTMEGGVEVNLQSVKVWIASAFLNQGFDFQTS